VLARGDHEGRAQLYQENGEAEKQGKAERQGHRNPKYTFRERKTNPSQKAILKTTLK